MISPLFVFSIRQKHIEIDNKYKFKIARKYPF